VAHFASDKEYLGFLRLGATGDKTGQQKANGK